MALRWAVATGNWSATATWNGGTLPGTGDEVHAGGFTVTIDQDVNLGSAGNLCSHLNGSAAAGGTFVVSSMTTRAIIANVNLTAVQTSAILIVSATSGTLTLTGSVTGVGNNAIYGLNITGAGCTVNVVGNVIGNGTNGVAIGINAVATLNVTGNLSVAAASAGSSAVSCLAAATVAITGNVAAGSSGSFGINAGITSSNITVTGTVTGGTVAAAHGISATGSCNITCQSTLFATNGAAAISSSSNAAVVILYGPFISALDGTQAAYCTKYYIKAATSTSYTQRDDTSHLAVTQANVLSGLPATSDVRNGTTYGSGGTNTGTCVIPAASSVQAGALVDNTVGTAALSVSDIWALQTSTLTTAGSIGERLKNAAVVNTTGSQIAAATTK